MREPGLQNNMLQTPGLIWHHVCVNQGQSEPFLPKSSKSWENVPPKPGSVKALFGLTEGWWDTWREAGPCRKQELQCNILRPPSMILQHVLRNQGQSEPFLPKSGKVPPKPGSIKALFCHSCKSCTAGNFSCTAFCCVFFSILHLPQVLQTPSGRAISVSPRGGGGDGVLYYQQIGLLRSWNTRSQGNESVTTLQICIHANAIVR